MMQVAFIFVLFGGALLLDVGSTAKMRLCLHMLFYKWDVFVIVEVLK